MWVDISESIKWLLKLDSISEEEVWDLSLVLTARNIPHEISMEDRNCQIWVPFSYFNAAIYEIELYYQENDDQPMVDETPRNYGKSEPTVWIFFTLILFYLLSHSNLIKLDNSPLKWNQIGSVDVWFVQQGQIWRLVTGLTLHAGISHLISNIIVGGIFVMMVCRSFGSGFGWFCVLIAGITGNTLNCFIQPYNHISIGASTSIFGAVGILAGARMFQNTEKGILKQALPFMAGLGLLSLLGTGGENTDLGAHIFGFFSGLALGFLVQRLPITLELYWPLINRVSGGLAIGIIILSWSWAIIYSS